MDASTPMNHPHLVTVPDLYQFIDQFLEEESRTRLNSPAALAELATLVEGVSPPLSALATGDLALRALKLGMVSGISDGWKLAEGEPWEEEPQPTEETPLGSSWSTLRSNLRDVRATAHTSWKAMKPDDLHLLWEYGRHQNLDTLKQAFAYTGEADSFPFQRFLLATFKSGYAVSMAQAVWKFR